nr:immunoglobulin light chain junction region [Macaca mulatta]
DYYCFSYAGSATLFF